MVTNNAANAQNAQYNLIVGTGSAYTNIAPSATSGVPLISQGNAANPAYGTAVVAGGGTGVTSNTAYAVLCGGTTGTGPIQSVASVGSAGQILTSNGIGALPTFQGRIGFFGYLSSAKTNVTGDGTVYTVPFDATKYDTASKLNTTTGVYTISQTGIWAFGCNITLTSVGAGHTSGQIIITQGGGAQNYYGPRVNFAAIRRVTQDADTVLLPFQFESNFTLNDTLSVTVTLFNSTKTVGVIQTADAVNFQSCFWGHYIGPI